MRNTRTAVRIAAAALAASACVGVTSAQALAQRPAAEIIVVQGQTQGSYRVLGEVRAEIHQKSIIAKTPARELADKQLKTEAAKLGADAVIDVKYENNSPMFSKKGFVAVGKAVKLEASAAPVFAAAPLPPAPVTAAVVAPPVATAAIAVPAPVPAPIETKPVQAPVVTAGVTAAVTPPPPVSAPPPPVPGPRPPTPQALIVLAEDNLSGRAVAVLGVVEAEAHQTSLFPKKGARDVLQEDLKAKAYALGADAVISIKYDMNSPVMSKKGSHATGVAVKFQ